MVQAGPKYAFGDEGREGCPPGSKVDMVIELVQVKAVKSIDPDHEGHVFKTILKDGEAHQCPNDSAEVCVSWTGKLANGTEFDKVRCRRLWRRVPVDCVLVCSRIVQNRPTLSLLQLVLFCMSPLSDSSSVFTVRKGHC